VTSIRHALDDPEYLGAVVDRIPMGHVGAIADVAGAVVYLASDAAAMVTGTILPVDDGWTAQIAARGGQTRTAA
jgi:NAD(P)-dependent dehydrogenase (short-subunit alcohol dehydrogenase family)